MRSLEPVSNVRRHRNSHCSFVGFATYGLSLLLVLKPAYAQTQIVSPLVEDVAKEIEKGNCKKGWDKLFPALKAGDKFAMQAFVALQLFHVLKIPGLATDDLARRRRIIIFSAYGADGISDFKSSIGGIYLQAAEDSYFGEFGALNWCLGNAKSAADVSECQAQAVKDDILPTYPAFMAEFEATGGQGNAYSCESFGDTLRRPEPYVEKTP